MIRNCIAIGIAALMLADSPVRCADVNARSLADIKADVSRIQTAGELAEVKFLQKDRQKLIGRLGAVSETGFEVQPAKEGQGVAQTVAFTDVKSVKAKKGMHPAAKAALISGAIVGALALTFGILCGSGYCDQ